MFLQFSNNLIIPTQPVADLKFEFRGAYFSSLLPFPSLFLLLPFFPLSTLDSWLKIVEGLHRLHGGR